MKAIGATGSLRNTASVAFTIAIIVSAILVMAAEGQTPTPEPVPTPPGQEASATPGTTATTLEHTITGLDTGEIYAFQLNYTVGSMEVFSAREMYAWPSNSFPGILGYPDRVATYPYFGHWTGREYKYTICKNTFPSQNREQWVDMIKHAFEQWEVATDRLVEMTPTVGVCDMPSVPVIPIKLISIMLNAMGSEVYMVDTSRYGIIPSLISQFLDNPLSVCVFFAEACVVSQIGYTNPIDNQQAWVPLVSDVVGVDVLINSEMVSEDTRSPDIPGDNTTVSDDDIVFNTCLASAGANNKNFQNYKLMVHEAGHALGMSGYSIINIKDIITGGDLTYERAHPNKDPALVTVMDYNWDKDCSPHPLDIMAIYALYQKIGP